MTQKIDLAERLRALAEQYEVVGASAGLRIGTDEQRASFGVTHVEHPLAIDDRTLFQIASNTKPFVATQLMRFVEEGRLSLDDRVVDHLPAFELPRKEWTAEVRVRHLLTHRVGWDGDELFVRGVEPPELDAIFGPMRGARQLVRPGTHWTYGNASFSAAGLLVERLSGKPYRDALREDLLKPLGMTESCTRAGEAITRKVALPHAVAPDRDPFVLRGIGGWQRYWELEAYDVPAGGLASSVDEMLRWLGFWLGRGPEGAPLVSPETRARMLEDRIEPYNDQDGQAIGWAVDHGWEALAFWHGGLTAGYCSRSLFVPEWDLALVVLTSSTNGAPLHRDLSREILGAVGGRAYRVPAGLAPQPDYAPYLGDYWGAFGTCRVSQANAALELSVTRHPTDDGSWQPPPAPAERAVLFHPDHAIVNEGPTATSRIDFGPPPAPDAPRPWLRMGGRIHVRQDHDRS